MKAATKKTRPKYASGQQIGKRAKHVWVCTVCGIQTEKKPDAKLTTQCRGSGTKAHTAKFQHFASKAEAKRYHELRLLEKAGKIQMLKCQPIFALKADGGAEVGEYRADFAYADKKIHGSSDGWTYEDVKGVGAPMKELTAWKINHAERQYGIKINIVRR